ncbi:MAG: DUF4190 domain-containing protein [Verrucomicrobia bacterium]|jgi:hypothetical protein|nr:DUF4190 domain-containing protein [Verrucomicrobiota bacterium]
MRIFWLVICLVSVIGAAAQTNSRPLTNGEIDYAIQSLMGPGSYEQWKQQPDGSFAGPSLPSREQADAFACEQRNVSDIRAQHPERTAPPWKPMDRIIFAMFWVPVLYFFIHFSFRSRGAKRAVWQANLGMFCGCLGFLVLPVMGAIPLEILMPLAGFAILAGLLAIPLGHTARRRINRSDGRLVGSGRAGFALVAGYLVAGCLICLLVLTIKVGVIDEPAIQANLAAIDRAKIAWAAATGAGEDASPTPDELAPFFPGKMFPTPVASEIYEINPIGVKASHTIDVGQHPPTTPRQPPWEASQMPPLPEPSW